MACSSTPMRCGRWPRAALRLAFQPVKSAPPLGVSRAGGAPDLPAALPWPSWRDTPLGFVVQIALHDLAGSAVAAQLPASGLLSFFVDPAQRADGSQPADRGAWAVVFSPAGQLARRTPPAGSAPPLPVSRAHFTPDLTLPNVPTERNPALTLTAEEQASYELLLLALRAGSNPAAARNRLFGEPDSIQDDVLLTCAAASAPPDPLAWQLLLQLDSDEAAGMRWGSAGMLYFAIPRAALAAQQFDAAWAVIQSD